MECYLKNSFYRILPVLRLPFEFHHLDAPSDHEKTETVKETAMLGRINEIPLSPSAGN